MRIYLSGPMTGQKDLNRKAFADVAFALQSEGHFVIDPQHFTDIFGGAEAVGKSFAALYAGNPKLVGCDGKPIDDGTALARAVMEANLAALRTCDAIYMLRGWESSRGARKELAEAIAHGLSIISEGAPA